MSSIPILLEYRAFIERCNAPREKFRSFDHLSQEILERIVELVDAHAHTSKDLRECRSRELAGIFQKYIS